MNKTRLVLSAAAVTFAFAAAYASALNPTTAYYRGSVLLNDVPTPACVAATADDTCTTTVKTNRCVVIGRSDFAWKSNSDPVLCAQALYVP